MFIQILINSAKFLQLVEHGQQILWFKLGQIKDAKKRKWSYRGFPFPQFLKKQVDFEPIKLHLQKFWVRSLKTSLFRLLCLFRMASAKQFITITTAALLILMRRPNPWISISSISTWVKRSRSRSRPVDTEKLSHVLLVCGSYKMIFFIPGCWRIPCYSLFQLMDTIFPYPGSIGWRILSQGSPILQ